MRGKKRFRGYMGVTLIVEVSARTQNGAFKKAQKEIDKINEAGFITVSGEKDGKETKVYGKLHPGSAYTNCWNEIIPPRAPRTRRTNAPARRRRSRSS